MCGNGEGGIWGVFFVAPQANDWGKEKVKWQVRKSQMIWTLLPPPSRPLLIMVRVTT